MPSCATRSCRRRAPEAEPMRLLVVPTRAFVWLSVAPLALSVFVALEPSLLKSVLLLDGALFTVALLDLLFCVRRQLEIRRTAPDVLSLKRRNLVRLELSSRAGRRLHIEVRDDLFPGAHSADLPARGEISARGQLTLTYHVEPSARGAYTLGDHHLRYRSLLGLWQRQIRVPAHSPVRVYPDLKQLQGYDLLARDSREYALVRVSRMKGGESEFARLRDQVPDDEHRSIDWKATARRQRLTVREYQLESNQNLLFMLDAGRMMTGIEAGLSRFDHALNASLMLSHVASRTPDRDTPTDSGCVRPPSGAGRTGLRTRFLLPLESRSQSHPGHSLLTRHRRYDWRIAGAPREGVARYALAVGRALSRHGHRSARRAWLTLGAGPVHQGRCRRDLEESARSGAGHEARGGARVGVRRPHPDRKARRSLLGAQGPEFVVRPRHFFGSAPQNPAIVQVDGTNTVVGKHSVL